MESDNAGSKPELVCAPCWICLEDGPDESGEPLVRDCACRGETSAGYHLSCLIDYARLKTDEAIAEKERCVYLRDMDDVVNAWKKCENCTNAYSGSVALLLADAFVEKTKNLPETNGVRFEARMIRLEALETFSSKEKESLLSAEVEIKNLLEIVNEKTDELGMSMFGSTTMNDEVRAFQSSRLLSLLGRIKQKLGDNEAALKILKTALENFDTATALGCCNSGGTGRTVVVESIARLKNEMGLISPLENVKHHRERLTNCIKSGHSDMEIAVAKNALALALLGVNPPQYFEAIQLKKEAVDYCRRNLGSDHYVTKGLIRDLADFKEEYRKHLQKTFAAGIK